VPFIGVRKPIRPYTNPFPVVTIKGDKVATGKSLATLLARKEMSPRVLIQTPSNSLNAPPPGEGA